MSDNRVAADVQTPWVKPHDLIGDGITAAVSSRQRQEDALDETLEESFPASDPPPFR